MYQIEIPNTVQNLLGVLYLLGMWSDTTSFGTHCRKLLYFIYFASFVLWIAVGACITDDKDESVFLTVGLIVAVVQTYRMSIILWRKNGLLLLVNQICTYSTSNREEFIQISNKLNVFMKFVRYFMLAIVMTTFFGGVLFPITNENLTFNIAFPIDWHSSEIAFFIASVFVGGGFFCGVVAAIINQMVWYLMLSISFEYQILGNQLRHMGTIKTGTTHLKVSLAAQQQIFFKDFIAAIETYDKINGYTVMHLYKRCNAILIKIFHFRSLEDFSSYFGNLFLLQIATGSLGICGSVYSLAFVRNKFTNFYCYFLTLLILFAEHTRQFDTRWNVLHGFNVQHFWHIYGHVFRERNSVIQWCIVAMCVRIQLDRSDTVV